nr:unnamed protein product [Digitaria exilis]
MDARASSRATNERRRHRKNKKKTAAGAEPPITGPTSIHDVHPDLLKLILLRLDSSLWLIRAASVCKLWRSTIAGGDFLRLSGDLHPPAIAGHYHLMMTDPTVFVPSSSPAVLRAGRFRSFGFLPPGKTRWEVVDCHGGLVLLRDPYFMHDLVVCNPLTKLHQGILNPRGKVFYMFVHHGEEPQACVFSMGSEHGDWRVVDTLGKDVGDFKGAHLAGRLDDGRLCMGVRNGRVMVLDNVSLEFTQLDLPNQKEMSVRPKGPSSFRIVHSSSGDGVAAKATRIVHVDGYEIEVFRQERSGGGWMLEHRLSEMANRRLPGHPASCEGAQALDWIERAVADGAGFVVLSVQRLGRNVLVTVDVETMKMELLTEETYYGSTCPYTLPWPPLVQACVGKSRRRRR